MASPARFQVAPIHTSAVSSRAHHLASPGLGGAAAFEPPDELDDFVVLRRLGQGATGQAYLAEDSAPTGSRGAPAVPQGGAGGGADPAPQRGQHLPAQQP